MKLSEIYEGWRNKLLPPEDLKDMIKKTSEERINICLTCPHHSKNHKTKRPDAHCTNCGCTLSAKTACLSCSCPLNKWVAVATGEEEEQLKKQIGHGEQSSET
jgi:hypothetical protein